MFNKRLLLPLILRGVRKSRTGQQKDIAVSEHIRKYTKVSEMTRRKWPKCNSRPSSSWLPYVLVCTVTLCSEIESPFLSVPHIYCLRPRHFGKQSRSHEPKPPWLCCLIKTGRHQAFRRALNPPKKGKQATFLFLPWSDHTFRLYEPCVRTAPSCWRCSMRVSHRPFVVCLLAFCVFLLCC